MPNLIVPGPFTELSAVNYVMRAMGNNQLPVGTNLSTVTQADVINILGHFNDITTEVLAMGEWKFNSEIGYQLQPSGQLQYNDPITGDTEVLNVFAVPSTLASFRLCPTYAQTGPNYVDLSVRASAVFTPANTLIFYDRAKNREGFNAPAYPFLALDVAWFTPFVYLPPVAQLWICARTARRAVEQGVNSSEIAQFVKADEAFAFSRLKRLFGRDDSYNALRTVNAYRAYGNRPATNVGFIDIRGLTPPVVFNQPSAPALIIIALTTPTGAHATNGLVATACATINNPGTAAQTVTLTVTPDGVHVTSASLYLTNTSQLAKIAPTTPITIPPGGTITVDMVYNTGTTGAGTVSINSQTTINVTVT